MVFCLVGDCTQKPYITAEPGVKTIDFDGTEEYMVIACDGLWDVLDPQDLPKIVK